MESEGFYVTLPSNASKEFKDNTSSCYTMDLAKSIELTGEWIVGLCEFIYPHTWYNLSPGRLLLGAEPNDGGSSAPGLSG